MGLRVALVAGASLLAVLALTSPANASTNDPVVRVTHGDPFANCTLGGTGGDTSFPGTSLEPSFAIDPAHLNRIIGVSQQDRWSDGGSRGIVASYSTDNGQHFAQTPLPFSACAPGGLPYTRASNAWLSIGPDGTAYADALNINVDTGLGGIATATSSDGGRTWTNVHEVIAESQAEFGDDKPSVTADPVRAGVAYETWDRCDSGPNNDGSVLYCAAMLSVTHDFGRNWSTPRAIWSTANTQVPMGNLIVVDGRTGALYDVCDLFAFTSPSTPVVAYSTEAVIRSDDGGQTWSAPVIAGNNGLAHDLDPNTGAELRSGNMPDLAIDQATGELYLAYEGSDFTAGKYNQIEFTHSTDGGRTWSAPVRVSGAPQADAFTPQVAVTANGTVAVSYYDLRNVPAGDTTTLPTTTWLTTSTDHGQHFGTERQLGPAFDFLRAPFAQGFGYFLGDYQSLSVAGNVLEPVFEATDPTTSTAPASDLFTARFDTCVPVVSG